METEPRFQDVECGYVKILASPLTPIIKGGDQLNVPYEEPVCTIFIRALRTFGQNLRLT